MPLLVPDQVEYSRHKNGGDSNPNFRYNLSNRSVPGSNLMYFLKISAFYR
jgi:hypothetical protein